MQFDEHGHLQPYEVIEIPLADFEAQFVVDLPDQAHRRGLFDNYLAFTNEVKRTFGTPFFQWIGGSFVTTKEFPGDVDVVTFLPYDLMIKKAAAMNHLQTVSKQMYLLDAFFSPTCKWNHRFYETSVERERTWKKLYGFTRPDDDFVRLPKGIIKIDFRL